jgi:hypothetical protein
MIDPLLQDRKRYPDMTHWFNPGLLLKLLWNVIVSSTFGQYADRRLMVAALDTVDPKEHLKRATKHDFPEIERAVWIDFVADLGDGFNSTYAVASLLAREKLEVGGLNLPRGQVLFMGGDEVYPAATADAYKHQMRDPYAFALRDPDRKADAGIPLYAIPGNHDWYDGLVHFLAFFCREKPWHIGAWRSEQRRSYFAVKVTETWWVWCIDIQLADDMDQPQADYFKAIAAGMPANSKIILCGAEPGWLYTHTNRASLRIMSYAGEIAMDAALGHTIPLVLSGDTHHYSRYASEDGLQFITSGGGGAFLHPTHQLEDQIDIRWLHDQQKKRLFLDTDPATGQRTGTAACYPTRERSKSLLWGNLLFAATNWDFTILMGVFYWLFAVGLSLRPQWDAYSITALIFIGAFAGYTKYQEKSDAPAIYISSIIHGLLHAFAVIWLTSLFWQFNGWLFPPSGPWYNVWLWLGLLLVEAGIVGGIIGSCLFGLNLLVTCRWFNLNHNDAFSSMRLDTYKNFLRIKIEGNQVTIYAIGLDKVPSRKQWRANAGSPAFISSPPLQPHLIEKPIVLRAS